MGSFCYLLKPQKNLETIKLPIQNQKKQTKKPQTNNKKNHKNPKTNQPKKCEALCGIIKLSIFQKIEYLPQNVYTSNICTMHQSQGVHACFSYILILLLCL